MGFWDDVKESNKDADFDAMAVQPSKNIPPAKDYYCKVIDWKFECSAKKGTPGCKATVEIIAPCDGNDVEATTGMKFYMNMWMSGPRPKGHPDGESKGAFAGTLRKMMVMSGEPLKSFDDVSKANLKTNVFKVVGNKHEMYNNEPQFRDGFINAMRKEDYIAIQDMGIDINIDTPPINGDNKPDKDEDEF